jgi:chromosome segregation protein
MVSQDPRPRLFLKSSKSGRAHFIVLNNTSAVEGECPDNTDRAGHSGFIGSLFEMIDVKQGCEQVIGRLLKDVYLVERSELENGIARPETTLISKDGDTRRGIVFSGGYNSCDEYTSIIGRDAKIKELAHDVEGLRSQISEYEQEHSRMAFRLEQMKKDVSGQEDISKREEIKLNSIDAQRLKISEQIDRLQEELKLIRLELEETIEEESSLKLREESLSAQYKELEEKQQELDILISNNQQEISQKTSEKEEAIALLAEIRTEMSLVSEKYESQNATLSMLKGALENEKISASDRKIQAQQARSRSESLQSDIEALVKSNEDLRAEIDGINGTLLKLQEERKSIYILVEQFENKTRDMQKELDELRSSISNSHINASELSYTLSSIKERVESSYRIDIENEGVVFNGIEDFSSMSEELTCLKEKIERMGPVNLVAIDEHKELKERYDFLSTQQQDLVDAKESLHKAINKINRTTRKMFIETFDAIKVAFKEYFKLLFGGGTAELFLMDQSDILESGIEIIVRPPGKKLQSISLLSGGEKALTSVALLFALFKVRPTPFCILDEIDAPLDEANIDRFSRMLEEFIHSTQFIVITHNKKTISASDVMYGITMEKSGISKIVSVKLADDERIQRRRKLAEIEGVSRLKDISREPEEESGVVEPVTENK